MSQPDQPGTWLGEVHTAPPERRPPIAAALLAVGAVVAIGLVAALLFFGGGSPAASPTPTSIAASPATPSPTAPTTATATPSQATPSQATPSAPATTPSPDGGTPSVGRTPPPDVAAQIDTVVEQVALVRELEPLRDVPYVFLNREEFQSELEQILADEIDRDRLATEARLLTRLGMLPEDADLYELLLDLYGSQIAAYYRTDTRSFYVIERDEPFAAVDRMIVAHEYTHALQDMHFDLEGNRITDPSEGDAALAQLAAVEGDASLLMVQWAFDNLSIREQLELFAGLVPTPTDQELLESMPPILRRQLEFPYSEGALFSIAIQTQGGWPAIDETLSRPPASTEQVLHPDKYLDGEAPILVEQPDLLPVLGSGWQAPYRQVMGELNIQVWLADGEVPPMVLPGQVLDPLPWQAAAAGWGGDRLVMYEHADGRWLIDWHTAWDTADDADEFRSYAVQLEDSVRGHLLVETDQGSGGIRVMLADSVETMDLVQPAR